MRNILALLLYAIAIKIERLFLYNIDPVGFTSKFLAFTEPFWWRVWAKVINIALDLALDKT